MEKNDYIFGLRAVMEALESGRHIDKVLMRRDLSGDLAKELSQALKLYDIPVQKVPAEKLNRITMKNHQGVIALLAAAPYHKLENVIPALYEEGKNPFILVLDGVTDTRNFGAIARSADCAGVDAIVIPERGSASVTPDAMKTSAGALLYVPVCREKDLTKAITFLRENGLKIVAATEKGAEDYTKVDMSVPTAVVMGAEETGISDDILRQADSLAAIPLRGRIGSLNVSVAAGVLMYEVVRQRGEG
ncbi:MAG: 23S rRNA (guanosine(2251)-2'-O)-methyltransferase RlmB [Bacteroides sp.]|nr:23S rRNA (guanosine(2251)-2'-O)-methyltransferase RlmB [Bacteroides sp.]